MAHVWLNHDHDLLDVTLRTDAATPQASEQTKTAPPAGSVVVCLDEMGPESAKSFPGTQLIAGATRPAERATQEIDYGRRGAGYVFGALQPATGEVLTWTAPRRTTAVMGSCPSRRKHVIAAG